MASPDWRLCLWGPSAAGKTALLAQLYQAGAVGDETWEVLATAEALPFVDRMRQTMSLDNRFPAATVPGDVTRLGYHFRHRTNHATATLVLEDRAGADSEGFDAVADELAAADGLILLLDRQQDPARLEALLRRTLERLQVRRALERDPRPIAVCLSKADRFIASAEDLARAQQSPEDFVRGLLPPRVLAALATYCGCFRLFPLSAIGVRLEWGAVLPVVFLDEEGAPRLVARGEPVHLLAPFTWVLDQLAARLP